MADQGWIKLHRKFRDNPIYGNPHSAMCWIECLLSASHKDKDFYVGRKKIHLKAGQFITGRHKFGQSIGISASNAWYWLLNFQLDSMLDIKSYSKYSLITIRNWQEYQGLDSKVDSKKTAGWTANEQQMNTIKNEKNEKNTLAEYFNFEEYCQEVATKGHRISQVMVAYWKHKGITMASRKQASQEIGRWSKLAGLIGEYTDDQIAKAMTAMDAMKLDAGWGINGLANNIARIIAYCKPMENYPDWYTEQDKRAADAGYGVRIEPGTGKHLYM